MKTKNKIIITLAILFLFTGTLYATSSIFGELFFENNDAVCSSANPGDCIENDKWTLNDIKLDIYNTEVAPGKFGGTLAGSIKSTLFGDFSIESSEISLMRTDMDCGDDSKGKMYYLSGFIKSDYFGEMKVVNDSTDPKKGSYYCTTKDGMFFTVESDLLGVKNISGEGGVKIANIFEKQQVAIIGASNFNIGDELLNESGDTQINEVAANFNATESSSLVDQNIEDLTRNISSISSVGGAKFDLNTEASLTSNGENIYYYNLTDETGSNNGYENNGKNLKITSKTITGTLGFAKYTVDGKNTVIVKGGNIYITADISNKNNKSLLTLVAKREGKKGGNIYIHPDVTNIDAVIIADGSIMSYEDDENSTTTDILTRNSAPDKLFRQLYIYGSVQSNNVIGSKETPTGSDKYLKGDKDDFATSTGNIYDLANLRAFQMRYASSESSVNDCGGADKTLWVPGITGSSTVLDKVKENAWAGKMKCFNPKVNPKMTDRSDYIGTYKPVATPVDGLRTTGRVNSVVIEYNPAIQTETPFILRKNK